METNEVTLAFRNYDEWPIAVKILEKWPDDYGHPIRTYSSPDKTCTYVVLAYNAPADLFYFGCRFASERDRLLYPDRD